MIRLLNLLSFVLMSFGIRDYLLGSAWWRSSVHHGLTDPLSTLVGMIIGGIITVGVMNLVGDAVDRKKVQ